MTSVYAYLALLAAVVVYAFVHGDREARLIAVVCVAASALTAVVLSPLVNRYAGMESGVAMIDLIVLAIFIGIALRSTRFWPLWISGLQLTTAFAHLLRAIEPELLNVAYAAALRFWSYPILLIVALAIYRSHRRRLTLT